MDLDAILSGTAVPEPPPPAPPPAEPPAPPPQDAPAEPRTFPPGENPPADDPPDEPPAPPAGEQDAERVPIAALRDERKKRQEQERENAEFRRKVEFYEQQIRAQQQAAQQPPAPDLFQDPDGTLNHLKAELRREMLEKHVNSSVALARSQHRDYDDAEAAFMQACHGNRPLYEQMLAHPAPAEFAYHVGQQMLAMREIGNDPRTYRERVRAEEREAVRKELEAEQQSKASQLRASVPPTLANARDTAGRFAPAWSGPPALKDILASGRR